MNWLPMKLGLKVALNPFSRCIGNTTSPSIASKFQAKKQLSLKPRHTSEVTPEEIFSSLALQQSQNKLRWK